MSRFDLEHIFNSPTYKLMKEIENLPHMQLLRVISSNQAISHMRAIEQVFPTNSILRDFNNNPIFTHAFSLAEKLSVFESHLSYRDQFVEVLKQYEELDLEAFIEEYEVQVEEGPQNSLSLEFYLGMLLSLVMFIYSEYSSYLSEQQLIEQIQGLANQVQLLTDKLEESQINTFFVVEKSLNLRSEPSLESEVLDVLPEKLKLVGLESSGKWLRVEYFDYLSNTMESGWVHSDYLQVVILNDGA
ncbi:SH3 domain-containing protein [Vibrio parahaemolyticus]|uniref:SH3 domain-containing protein n=1 Tax=Vibrio parahaemolyticus TaxID=670 RepID=UPI001FACFF20|nr:SH3 domain-containing protein [Vibrio parahaemolyticus]MCI9718736.1 SH3 domain-containing protein [Vibrio parahaemolyticus]